MSSTINRQFWKRKSYVQHLYDENEKNQNLTIEQHKLIQEFESIRHKMHNSGYKVYLNKPVTKEIAAFFNKPESDFTNIGMSYPYLAVKLFKNLETIKNLEKIANPTENQVKTSASTFLYEKEFINDVMQAYTQDIDRQFGTTYSPSGKWRKQDINEYHNVDIERIIEAYHKGTLYEELENLSEDCSVTNLHMNSTEPGVKRITGMYETTPFSAYIVENGPAIDIKLHTPGQDLDPAPDIESEIIFKCKELMESEKDTEYKKPEKALLIGMDGTLTDLTGGVLDANGRIHMQSIYDILEKPGFFKTLEPIKNVVEAVRRFVRNHSEVEVFILSTAKPDDPPGVPAQKHDWMNRNLPEISPEHRLFVYPNISKAEFVLENKSLDCYLIDDNLSSLEEFEKAGGHAIKSGSITDEVFIDNNINYEQSASEIYEQIEKTVGTSHIPYELNREKGKNQSHKKENEIEL